MSKCSIVNDHIEEYVVIPPAANNFKEWWDTELIKVRYHHEQHGLARKPPNSEKRAIREAFLKFVDEHSQLTGRNNGSFGVWYYFNQSLPELASLKGVRRILSQR